MDSLRHYFGGLVRVSCYAAAPTADVATNGHPTWVTAAGLAIGLGGLVCHAIQTWVRVRESGTPPAKPSANGRVMRPAPRR